MRLFLAKLNPSIHVTCVRKRQSLENLIGFLSFGVGEKLFCMKERERKEHGKFTSVGVPTLLFALIVVLQIEPFKTFETGKN